MSENEIKRAVEFCCNNKTTCSGCPLDDVEYNCGVYLTQYIAAKENEPAPAATETSSEVSSNDTSNLTHLDDNTSKRICQVFELMNRTNRAILEMYEDMSESERNAFNLGVIRRDVLSSIGELEDLKNGDGE